MCLYKQSYWFSGSGQSVDFDQVIDVTLRSIKSESKIFIGTDSFVSKKKVTFATAICLHGGGISRYFFFKNNHNSKNFKNLISRITEEAKISIDLAELLISKHGINKGSIELHLDVSPKHLNNGTSRFSDMLKGYVSGYNLECKLKPDAWASQTVADRHSK
tara:strand:- start:13664 stop:14146 length:483 start_codon:yes stop_codon:yes gene_type:complete